MTPLVRYGFGALAAASTVIVIACGAARAVREYQAARALEKGMFVGDTALFDGCGLTDGDVAAIARKRPTKLLLNDNPLLTDAGLRAIDGSWSVEHLSLGNTAITDGGLQVVAALGDLRSVLLEGCQISDASMKALCANTMLRVLNVSRTQCTLNIPCLADSGQLEEIWAAETPLSAGGMSVVAGCRGLRTLSLANCTIPRDLVCPLVAGKPLEHLDLSGATLGTEELRCIAKLSNLLSLVLDDCQLAGSDLLVLSSHPTLRVLSVRRVNVSMQTIQSLRASSSHVQLITE